MTVVQYLELPPERWQEYRDLRIESVQLEPYAFLGSVSDSQKLSEADWQARMKNMMFAEVNGTVVGMIGRYRENREKTDHVMQIVSFYVRPDWRGKGIGKGLLNQVIAEAREHPGVKKLELGVVPLQEAALNLYLNAGFSHIGTLHAVVCVDGKFYDEQLLEMLMLEKMPGYTIS